MSKTPVKITTLDQLRAVAQRSSGFTSEVLELTTGALEEIAALKADKGVGTPFSIPATGWVEDEIEDGPEADEEFSGYNFYRDFTVNGLYARDRVDVTVGASGSEEAVACGLCPFTEAFNGKFRLRAARRPTTAIQAERWIFRGKE